MSETKFLIGRSGLDLKDDFYPDEMPSDWRFAYYSAIFKALSLSLDSAEDLPSIFHEVQTAGEEFELVLSLHSAYLFDFKKLSALLNKVSDYKNQFILWADINQEIPLQILKILADYRLCLQSQQEIKIDLKQKIVADKIVYFNHIPVIYAPKLADEKQMRIYLQSLAHINSKTVLICPLAQKQELDKMNIIAQLLGF